MIIRKKVQNLPRGHEDNEEKIKYDSFNFVVFVVIIENLVHPDISDFQPASIKR